LCCSNQGAPTHDPAPWVDEGCSASANDQHGALIPRLQGANIDTGEIRLMEIIERYGPGRFDPLAHAWPTGSPPAALIRPGAEQGRGDQTLTVPLGSTPVMISIRQPALTLTTLESAPSRSACRLMRTRRFSPDGYDDPTLSARLLRQTALSEFSERGNPFSRGTARGHAGGPAPAWHSVTSGNSRSATRNSGVGEVSRGASLSVGRGRDTAAYVAFTQ
jgi:hypothetical protein